MKTVLLIERHSGLKVIAVSQGLNFKSRDSLSALELSDPRPKYIRKFRVLPFCSASVKSKFNIVVANDDIWNSYFHSPDSYWGADNSSCLRRSYSTTCSDDSAEDCGIGVSVDVRHTDFSFRISKRERSLLVNVSGQELDFRVTVASHVPDHHSLLPTICEACTWPPRSYSDLIYGRRRVSEDNWPVHGRCRERSRVVLPVGPGFRDSCSSRQMWLWHLSLAFSKFAEGYLPQEAVALDLPYALIVVVSNGLSLDQAQEHVVSTQLGLGRMCLTNSERLLAALRTVPCTRVFPKSNSDKCNKEREW